MDKTALILNVGYLEENMIESLRSMGFYVIGTGGDPTLRGKDFVDRYIQADYSDKELILKIAKENNIDAICSCANDFGVLTAAYVAEQLRLPGHDTYDSAMIMHNKERFKQFAKEHGINTPLAQHFSSEEEAIAKASFFNYPIIIKPTDLSAGRGINRVNDATEAAGAIKKAFITSRSHDIVTEPFIEGSLHACCTFIKDKKVAVCCSNNEYCFINPYRVEVATYPADHFDEVKEELILQVEKMAEVLNLKDGIFSMQYIYRDGKAYIIEAMRRVLGNLYMTAASRANNFDWNYWEARVHVGLDYTDFPNKTEQKGYYAYRAIMSKKNGIIESVSIPEEIENHIFKKYKLRDVGDKIYDFMSQPIWFLVMQFDSKEEMMNLMIENYEKIKVTIK